MAAYFGLAAGKRPQKRDFARKPCAEVLSRIYGLAAMNQFAMSAARRADICYLHASRLLGSRRVWLAADAAQPWTPETLVFCEALSSAESPYAADVAALARLPPLPAAAAPHGQPHGSQAEVSSSTSSSRKRRRVEPPPSADPS